MSDRALEQSPPYERILVWGLRFFCFFLPLLGVFAPRMVPLFLVLVSLPLLARLQLRPLLSFWPGVLLAGGVFLMAWLRAVEPQDVWPYPLMLLGMFILFFSWQQAIPRLPAAAFDKLGLYLLAGVGLGALLVAEEYYFAMPIGTFFAALVENRLRPLYVYDRGINILALLIWPLAVLLGLRFWQVLVMALAALYLTSLTSSQSSTLGILLGLVVFIAASLRPALMRWSLVAATLVTVLLAPLLPAMVIEWWSATHDSNIWNSANGSQRLQIWQNVARAALAQPWLGHGLDAARHLPAIMEHVHPHNGVLQIWLEFGLVGVAAWLAGLVWLLRRLPQSPTFFALYAAWMGVFVVSYNIWQPWWLAMPFLLASLQLLALRAQAARAV